MQTGSKGVSEIEPCVCVCAHPMFTVWTCRLFKAAHLDDEEEEHGTPEIILCANHLETKNEVAEVLIHEMVHAYDHCVARKDLSE